MGRSGRPPKKELPADSVQEFRSLLSEGLKATDDEGRVWADCVWGVYAFYDYDGEPIYVGQTNEQLRVRVQRHLTNQRTDAVAMRILDVFEVARVELYPLWEFDSLNKSRQPVEWATAKQYLNLLEYTVYRKAIAESRFKAILNEKIPPEASRLIDPLPPAHSFPVVSSATREVQGHPDVRLARRADTLSRLAAVAHERGEVSDGLRRVLVIQAVRVAYLGAERLAYVEGRPAPSPLSINMEGLVGSVLSETDEGPHEESDADEQD